MFVACQHGCMSRRDRDRLYFKILRFIEQRPRTSCSSFKFLQLACRISSCLLRELNSSVQRGVDFNKAWMAITLAVAFASRRNETREAIPWYKSNHGVVFTALDRRHLQRGAAVDCVLGSSLSVCPFATPFTVLGTLALHLFATFIDRYKISAFQSRGGSVDSKFYCLLPGH